MRSLVFALSAVVLSFCSAAHADTVYSLQNQTGLGSVGTVTINTIAGSISFVNATIIVGGAPVTFTGAASSQAYSPYLDEYQASFSSSGDVFQLNLPVSSLVGYAPADSGLCVAASFFCDYLANVYVGTPTLAGPVSTFEGNLMAQASSATPEPSSYLLLGTGLLGMAAFVRRRHSAKGI